MLVSVIIPAFNAERYLEESLKSVFSQTHQDIEVIVVDDGSTDNTAEIARSFEVRYVHQKNQGCSAAMNCGFTIATGDFIASNDADDIWLPEKLSLQLDMFRENPGLDIAFGNIEQFICPTVGENHQLQIPENSIILPGYSSVSMLIRRVGFEKVGNFNQEYTLGDFVEWYSRAQDAGLNTAVLNQVVTRRRIHGKNTGVTQKNSREDYLRIIKASLDRRRANAKN